MKRRQVDSLPPPAREEGPGAVVVAPGAVAGAGAARPAIRFHVTGDPKPKGSAKAFVVRGRAVVTNDCTTAKPWAERVHWVAKECAPSSIPPGAVSVRLGFVLPRPGRLGKKRSGVPSTTRPDIDKLARNVLDALTGVLFVDDAQVSALVATKRYADYGEAAGCTIEIEYIADTMAEAAKQVRA
jgi:Holliday junction resolvase RusA-like endonuclease